MQTRKIRPRRRKAKASTRDVLGIAAQPEPVPPRWKRHYEHLVRLRESLLRSGTNLAKDALQEKPTFSTLRRQ